MIFCIDWTFSQLLLFHRITPHIWNIWLHSVKNRNLALVINNWVGSMTSFTQKTSDWIKVRYWHFYLLWRKLWHWWHYQSWSFIELLIVLRHRTILGNKISLSWRYILSRSIKNVLIDVLLSYIELTLDQLVASDMLFHLHEVGVHIIHFFHCSNSLTFFLILSHSVSFKTPRKSRLVI